MLKFADWSGTRTPDSGGSIAYYSALKYEKIETIECERNSENINLKFLNLLSYYFIYTYI